MKNYGEGIVGLINLLSTFPNEVERCLDGKMGYAIWPRHADAILTQGTAAIEALDFTITERSRDGWRAIFTGFNEWTGKSLQLICTVGVEHRSGVPHLVARYHEKPAPKT
jgi:hypothetical protein